MKNAILAGTAYPARRAATAGLGETGAAQARRPDAQRFLQPWKKRSPSRGDGLAQTLEGEERHDPGDVPTSLYVAGAEPDVGVPLIPRHMRFARAARRFVRANEKPARRTPGSRVRRAGLSMLAAPEAPPFSISETDQPFA